MNRNTLKKKQKQLRNWLRDRGVLPDYGVELSDDQKIIWERSVLLDKTLKEEFKTYTVIDRYSEITEKRPLYFPGSSKTLKKKQLFLRNELRKYGLLPIYGVELNDEQKILWERTNNLDKTVLDIIKKFNTEKCRLCEEKVYDSLKLLCKLHYLSEHKGRKEKRCLVCGETDPNKFYTAVKSYCKTHLSEINIERQKNRKKRLNNVENYDDYKKMMINERFLGAKHRSFRKKFEFELTREMIYRKIDEQQNKCYLSGIEMNLESNSWESLTLDRKDPTKGYTDENVVLTTKFINVARGNMSLDEFNNRIQMYFGVNIY